MCYFARKSKYVRWFSFPSFYIFAVADMVRWSPSGNRYVIVSGCNVDIYKAEVGRFVKQLKNTSNVLYRLTTTTKSSIFCKVGMES